MTAAACRCLPAPAGQLFVLVQVLPRVEVLATSFDRARLLAEARTMVQQHREPELYRWFVRPVGVHLGSPAHG